MMSSLLQLILKEPRALNAIVSNGAKALSIPVRHSLRRRLHHQSSPARPPSFGIAFDIDGVLLRGETPIGGSPQALSRLYEDSGSAASTISALKIPYVFLTNGGGVPEFKRAKDLAGQLGVNVSPLQVIQGHTPFKQLLKRFENDLIVAVGKGEPANVMSEYGFKNVLSIDEYASFFDNIDPLDHYKNWRELQPVNRQKNIDPVSQRVGAVFVVSDSVDWSRDIQVLCDILRTGGRPGREIAHQPPLFFASDDLVYQALFPAERLGMGAFRIALESVFNKIHPTNMEYTSYGKPNPFVFKNAEDVLKQVRQSAYKNIAADGEMQLFKTLYMVGDNPSVDIKGAQQAGYPWFSILTRTGVFKGKGNHPDHPADLVVDSVEDAVDYIMKREHVR